MSCKSTIYICQMVHEPSPRTQRTLFRSSFVLEFHPPLHPNRHIEHELTASPPHLYLLPITDHHNHINNEFHIILNYLDMDISSAINSYHTQFRYLCTRYPSFISCGTYLCRSNPGPFFGTTFRLPKPDSTTYYPTAS